MLCGLGPPGVGGDSEGCYSAESVPCYSCNRYQVFLCDSRLFQEDSEAVIRMAEVCVLRIKNMNKDEFINQYCVKLIFNRL